MREWPDWEPKVKTLAEAVSFMNDFFLNHDRRIERNRTMKQKTWNEYRKDFVQNLGISEDELKKWKRQDVLSACAKISLSEGTGLKRFLGALNSSEWRAHDFLLMLCDHFKRVGYIKSKPSGNREIVEKVVEEMGKNPELVDMLWWDAIKKLPDALTFLRDFAYSYDNRIERDRRMKYIAWDEYKDTFSMRLGIERPEMDNWDEGVVVSACKKIGGKDLQSFYYALDWSEWKVHDFLLMLEKVFKQRWWIKKVK